MALTGLEVFIFLGIDSSLSTIYIQDLEDMYVSQAYSSCSIIQVYAYTYTVIFLRILTHFCPPLRFRNQFLLSKHYRL